jgi:capsular polysaccharide export protein
MSRRFLFLQGLPSRFFDELGKALRMRGHDVFRINFNGGDNLFWSAAAMDYTGDAASWPEHLAATLNMLDITDIVLFGDCRPLHRAAIVVAGEAGIQVHVFEEGYIRPDWITLEVGGVNGYSSMPRDADWYLQRARELPRVAEPSGFLPPTFRQRARDAVAYSLAEILGRGRYPHYRTHRAYPPLVEGLGWLGRLVASPVARYASLRESGRMGSTARVFLMPLQLDSDYQIRQHSPFGGIIGAISMVMQSFASDAPDDAGLLFKGHPLDNGLVDWRREVRRVARLHRIEARVFFVDDGDLGTFIDRACGMVTVNSTSGSLALARGKPVKTLGTAVYDLPGLTHHGDLASFWTSAQMPDPAVFDAFRRVLAEISLVRGGFYGSEAIAVAVAGSVARLFGDNGSRIAEHHQAGRELLSA